ncbi:phospholipase [Ciceribacter sp. L1K23]|uniref:alpha/beta hydrolase n=1 Tax=Ciceribacter sp. L1K23 TaxID=2820276 RepID=UPI0020137491|nr:phospholipase [Ciceribacter sp. L1K23]
MANHGEPLIMGLAPEDADVLCVFVHGRTQSPEDMIEQVIGRLSVRSVSFCLPRAAEKSWYAARATDALTEATRSELGTSLDYLHGLAGALRQAGGRDKPLLIGGFSQGACLSLEYAMTYGPWNGAMVNLTGCRVGQSSDTRPERDLDGMPVYLTGSDQDPWIPVHAFAEASEALGRARARLRCELFPGRTHQASEMEVAALDAMLQDLAEGSRPFRRVAA